ncbi:MAG: hypothetical protein WCK02_00260 [Bacteroidota bacterium]
MWTSTNFRKEEQLFDFSGAEQGIGYLDSLFIDDIEFINMIDRIGWFEEGQTFGALTCTGCGEAICSTGDIVAIRNLGDYIFFIPAFEKINADNLEDMTPPDYLETKGAYWLKNEDFDVFRKLVPSIDELGEIRQLSKIELIKLYKWDTPNRMFGKYPDFEPLKTNDIVSVSQFDIETVVGIIEQKLQALEQANSSEIALLSDNTEVISIFLNKDKSTEWKALCKIDGSLELVLGGVFLIKTIN